MRRPSARSLRPPKAQGKSTIRIQRDRLAAGLALATVLCLGAAFFFAKDIQLLMPGPLTSAHGTIKDCGVCHTQSGSGKLSWIHGLVAGDPLADSQACLTCHQMPDTAFNAHSASTEVLEQSTRRLTKLAAEIPVPQSARLQSSAFPTDDKLSHGLYCATCHQEHQGISFKLNKISNEQCRSCHVVKFDSFDGHHPEFENYPFKQRTQIIYDHAGHFGSHFPEVAKKDPAKRVPATCSTCHNSGQDKRVMAVAPFEQTCTGCHLDQIIGKERVSGPKGIAFLSVPGLDLQTLYKKKASIGEWPDASEAELTSFMKVMISRNERGRALIKTVAGLNLQDLSGATNEQIRAVTNLVWEIKSLFHTLIKGKVSDVLGHLNIGDRTKLSTNLVADLTASIPRDAVISAQQQWLPNLAAEMANRPTGDQKQSASTTTIAEPSLTRSASARVQSGSSARQPTSKHSPQTEGSEAFQLKGAAGKDRPDRGKQTLSADEPNSALAGSKLDRSESPERRSGSQAREATPSPSPEAVASEAAGKPRLNAQACIVSVFGQCLLYKGSENKAGKSAGAGQTDTAPKPDGGKENSSAEPPPPVTPAKVKEARQAAQPEGAAGNTKRADAKLESGRQAAATAIEPPQKKSADQTDNLLFPTEEELRALKAGNKDARKAAQSEGAARLTDTANAKADGDISADAASKTEANAPAGVPSSSDKAGKPQTRAASVIGIESSVDAESWAEYGGWYRQDHAIFYRPSGHKDKFIYAWLRLTGPQAPKGDMTPAAAVFDFLASKDAPGSCTKCHSVDDIQGKGRIVNFSPPSVESKQGRFTNFVHEPHFGILENRGCLTCHDLQKDRPYLQSYEHGNPRTYVSNFGEVKKDTCQTCHTSSMARQDCLLCHKYHVNGVVTPIMKTQIPRE